MYVPVPPVPDIVITPSLLAHVGKAVIAGVANNGASIVIDLGPIQPLASLILIIMSI